MSYESKSKKHYDDSGRDLYNEIFEKEASVLVGALAGGSLGAGVGYARSGKKNRLRNTLIGAGAGSVLGAGAGKLLSRSGGGAGGGGGGGGGGRSPHDFTEAQYKEFVRRAKENLKGNVDKAKSERHREVNAWARKRKQKKRRRREIPRPSSLNVR